MTSPKCEEAKSHSDLAWLQTNVFTPSCTFSGCHVGSATTAGHLTLEPGHAHDQLVGMASTSASTWKRVVAGDPSKSYLLVALGHIAGPKPTDGLLDNADAPFDRATLRMLDRARRNRACVVHVALAEPSGPYMNYSESDRWVVREIADHTHDLSRWLDDLAPIN